MLWRPRPLRRQAAARAEGRASPPTASTGDPNASTDTCEPLVLGPQFGAYGATAADISVAFVAGPPRTRATTTCRPAGAASPSAAPAASARRTWCATPGSGRVQVDAARPGHARRRPRPIGSRRVDLAQPPVLPVSPPSSAISTPPFTHLPPGPFPASGRPPVLDPARTLTRSTRPCRTASDKSELRPHTARPRIITVFFMPPEWHPHTRTWMSWPVAGYALADPEASYRAWASVANTIVRYEPVTMVVDPSERDSAARWLSPGVELMEQPLDDCWMRDIGPTFLVDGRGALAGVDWTFNGWGWHPYAKDDLVAAAVLERAGATRFRSEMVNEGGGIHVDGEGTVLVTETVQLGDEAQPRLDQGAGRGRAARPARRGRRSIWLPRGLTARLRQVRHAAATWTRRLLRPPRPGALPRPARPGPPGPRGHRRRTWRSCGPPPTRGAARWRSWSYRPETLEADGELGRLLLHQPLPVPTASSCSAPSTIRATPRRPRSSAGSSPERVVDSVDARDDLRPRRRHPLHHPAAAPAVTHRERSDLSIGLSGSGHDNS